MACPADNPEDTGNWREAGYERDKEDHLHSMLDHIGEGGHRLFWSWPERVKLDGRNRALAKETGYSYEHVRKVFSGVPVVGRRFSSEIAKALFLDPEVVWEQARKEKVARRYGYLVEASGSLVSQPSVPGFDIRLLQVWSLLTASQRDALYSIALEFLKPHQKDLETAPK